jgi:GTP-binding protein
MPDTPAPSPRGLLLSSFVISLAAPDSPVPEARPEIAVVGRSNVGKSTLLNGLVGRRALARTSQTPGKTRLLNVFAWGAGCYLVDVPGCGWARAGQAERAAWRRLVEGYIAEREQLVGVLWLLDLRRDPSPEDHAMSALLATRGVAVLAVLTKADQVPRRSRKARQAAILAALGMESDASLITSAQSGEGMEDLRDSVLAFLD